MKVGATKYRPAGRNWPAGREFETPVLILRPKHVRNTLSNDIAALDDIALASNETVKNLGFSFDPDLSFDSHSKLISWTADMFCLKKMQKN